MDDPRRAQRPPAAPDSTCVPGLGVCVRVCVCPRLLLRCGGRLIVDDSPRNPGYPALHCRFADLLIC